MYCADININIYITILSHAYRYVHTCTHTDIYIYHTIPYPWVVSHLQLLTRSTASRRPWVFVINGVSWIIFDVLVQIGICLMWYLRPLTPYSGAVFQKHAFRLDETSIFAFFCRFWNQFDVTCFASFWRTNGKFKSTYSSVAWRMSGNFKRTYKPSMTHAWKVQENLQ